jgi:hypothetical protein
MVGGMAQGAQALGSIPSTMHILKKKESYETFVVG